MALYLGLDCSTQSMTATLISVDAGERLVVFEDAIDFDTEFPEYETTNGVRRSGLQASAPPLMWAAALDRVMAIVSRESGADLSQLRAISGSAQQHGSVYLNASAPAVLSDLDPRRALAAQLGGIFARPDAPVWLDESAGPQCAAIEASVGGPEAVARLTGSRATARFTGPQIRRFAEDAPDAYARTHRIHLVSSFLASQLAGRDAPIDHGDGSGMNLMDIRQRRWATAALEATAPDLGVKLPSLAPSWSTVGPLAAYWQRRYGFPPAQAIIWSGDNPCSLVGTGVVREGLLAISLGTSDTVFGFTREPQVEPSGTNVFCAPTGGYMSLICFRNGSLARERVRDAHGLDWDGFADALSRRPAGNHGAMMLPWFEPEITPQVGRAGARCFGLDSGDAAANVRAVIEGQMMAMANHSRALTGGAVERIAATGGASANRTILQVMADVFGADVYPQAGGNSAALGAALRAFHADELSRGRNVPWTEVVAGFTDPDPETRIAPVPEHVRVYAAMREVYAQRERDALTAPRT